jgi:hypothetical protein
LFINFDHPVFTALDLATIILFQIQLVSFACNPNLQNQVSVFMPPSDRVAQLYPQAPGSLFISFYDSQGYGGDIITRLHTG